MSHRLLKNEIESSIDIGGLQAAMTGYMSLPNFLPILGDQVSATRIYAGVKANRQRTRNEEAVTNFNFTLNLQQLVENLTLNAIYIGLVPGMCRFDVDRVVELSIIDL